MSIDTAISVYKEDLYHFLCDNCKKWFSIGDWEPVEYLYCPHCGKKQGIAKSKVEFVESTEEDIEWAKEDLHNTKGFLMEVHLVEEITELRNKLDELERKILELERRWSVFLIPYVVPVYPYYPKIDKIYCSDNTKGDS